MHPLRCDKLHAQAGNPECRMNKVSGSKALTPRKSIAKVVNYFVTIYLCCDQATMLAMQI
jgi:hypothetical protein